MRWTLLICWLSVAVGAVFAQGAGSAFELTPRLAVSQDSTVLPSSSDTLTAANAQLPPFELAPRLGLDLEPTKPAVIAEPLILPAPATLEENTRPQGWVLVFTLLLLAYSAGAFIFFRGLYGKVYAALFNDNLLSQLFREREAGNIGSFVLAYTIFFVSGGYFLYLALSHFNLINAQPFWGQLSTLILGLVVIYLAKHFLLAVLGYVMPIGSETRRYSFTIMVFAIMIGLVLSVMALALAYVPNEVKNTCIWITAGLAAVLYLLRSIRGIFIANRFLSQYTFHFFLYLCAVEIIPVLWFYKLVSSF